MFGALLLLLRATLTALEAPMKFSWDRTDVADELTRAEWPSATRGRLEAVKTCVIGGDGAKKYPKVGHANEREFTRGNLNGREPPCIWDCYRRATMLEPLVHDLLQRRVPGDFLEAGVFRGGISIHLANLLAASGELGDADHSLWGVVRDHAAKTLYWRSAQNPSLQRLRLADVALAPGAAVRSLAVSGGPWFADAAGRLATHAVEAPL